MRKRYITVLAGIVFSMMFFTGCGSRQAAEREAQLQNEINELRQEIDDLRSGQGGQDADVQAPADDAQAGDAEQPADNAQTGENAEQPAISRLPGWKARRLRIFPSSSMRMTDGTSTRARSFITGWSMNLRSMRIRAIS